MIRVRQSFINVFPKMISLLKDTGTKEFYLDIINVNIVLYFGANKKRLGF